VIGNFLEAPRGASTSARSSTPVSSSHDDWVIFADHSDAGLSVETEIRAVILAFASGLAAAAAAQAAPLPAKPAAIGPVAAPPIELVDHGCAWGWSRVHWQDHWGYWHWHCVPNGHVHHGRTNLEHPYTDWRGPTGGWGNP
jgi:hypothetical protein